MDKVKTIKNYLQNQKKEWRLCKSSEAKYRMEVYDELLEVIDSIKEKHTSDDLEEVANGYAWAHDTIGVNKETFSTQNVPAEKMVRVPIGEEIKTAVLFGAQWQRAQIAARDKTMDYYTFENGEKRFAQYILEMISNGWHINAVKSACEKKIKEE